MAFIPQNFKDGSAAPPITAEWLNPLDVTVNFVLGGAQTVPAALTALGITTGSLTLPLAIGQGGTGQNTAAAALAALGGMPNTQAAYNALQIGSPPYIQTAAELAASVTPVNYAYLPDPINVLRYGIVPNSSADAAANTAALKTLLNPAVAGPTGRLIFPNTTGADIYYFAGVVPIRDGIHIDLMGCTINNTYTAASTDVNTGLFYALRDFTLENGSIITNVVTSAATGSGSCIEIGARGTGTYFSVFDSTLAVPMGNITLRNLRLSSTNTGTNANTGVCVQMLGGLVNVLVENVVMNGGGILQGGIYYEFGWATSPGGTAASQTSHAHNMTFRNVKAYNMYTGGTDGFGIGLTGCYNCTVDGLYVNGARNGFEYRLGEALFYNPWVNVDDVGAKHTMTLRNIVCEAITSTGISLIGAEAASGGYLSGAGLTASQQTDLMTFSVDGFAVGNGAGTGMFVSGEITAKNGYLADTAASGQLIISDDCVQFEFENVRIIGSSAQGVRANFPGIGVWGTPRQKIGEFRNCVVAGNGTSGFEFGANTRSVKIKHCRIGYNALYDPANEAVQAIGVLVDTGGSGVRCENCFVTTYGGANAYSITGTTSIGCDIVAPQGTVTTAGSWQIDGIAYDTGTNLASATALRNTADKYYGKRCVDSSTNKLFIAQGSTAISTWISVDAATTITPA